VAVSLLWGCDKSKVSKQITEDTRIVYRVVDEEDVNKVLANVLTADHFDGYDSRLIDLIELGNNWYKFYFWRNMFLIEGNIEYGDFRYIKRNK
jgi:hypothetical protein